MLALAGIAAAQASPSLVRRLTDARKIAAYDGGSKFVSTAADGSAVATIDGTRKVAVILDAKTGKVTDSTHAGFVTGIGLLPSNRGYWLGRNDGALIHVLADGKERVFEILPRRTNQGAQIDGVQIRGGHVAWSSTGADRGGVVDARNGKPRFVTPVPFGGYRQPRMFLSRDARHVVHYERDSGRGGRRLLVIRETATGKRIGTADSYVSHRDRSHAFGLDGVFTAARKKQGWHLHRLDFVTLQNHVIDDDLRGKHFVDLFMSPSAHYLLEGDFEDDGAMLYHLADGGAHRAVLGRNVMPVGFLGAADYGEELALTTADGRREGLSVWSTKTNELVATLPVGKGKRITQAGSLLGGKALWLQWWESKKDRSIVYHLEVVQIPD